MYHNYIKSLIDKAVALVMLLMLVPIGLITAGWLFAVNRSNPLFIQARPGKKGKIFQLIKFKTMTDQIGEDGELLPDDQRMTQLGQWVRTLSLDEIPQLINVLKGEMSLVGPRPLLVEYLSLYNEQQFRRHEVLPGITGWAQVNGRNALSWEERFELDLWYVDHLSFWLDMKICLLTIKKVFLREGISSANYVTMEKFKGTTE